MRRLLREPLLHFLLLGAGIFAAYRLSAGGQLGGVGEIVVTRGDLASMREAFLRTQQRPPTPEELDGLIRDRVQDEVYAREAVAMGLDQGDQIIQRRLRQKLQFFSEGLAPTAEPTDAELQVYLNAHAASYTGERRVSFRQVYLDPARHGANLARDADRLRARLNNGGAGASLAALGDPLMLEYAYDGAPTRKVKGLFGQQFVAALDTLVPGAWQGPVASGYGVHLVVLTARTGGSLPPLTEVREAVRRDWLDAQQREAAARFYRALLDKYAVIIDTSSTATQPPGPLGAR